MKLPSNVKGILFDLDETLLTDERVIGDFTQEVLAKLRSARVHLGACTGRNFSKVEKLLKPHFSSDDCHITSNGGRIITHTGTVLFQLDIPRETIADILSQTQDHPQSLHSLTHTRVNKQLYDKLINHKWDSPLEILTKAGIEAAPQLTIGSMSRQQLEELSRKWPQTHWEIMPNRIGSFYADIAHKDTSKGAAVHRWCKHFGISPDQVIAFGNGANDDSLFRVVKHSVAVSNATDELKALAIAITKSNNEEGPAHYLTSLAERSAQ